MVLDNSWWVRVLDQEGQNDAAVKYRRLIQRALQATHYCFERGRSFDIVVDDGRPISGYRRSLRLGDKP